MKKTLFLSFVACTAALALTATSCKNAGETEAKADAEESVAAPAYQFAYFELDRVIEEFDMANDLRAVVETKANNIQADITRRANKIQADYDELQDKINKGLVTRSTAEVQAQKLGQQEQNFNNYAQQKQQEIQEEQIVMMNQIGDAIKTFVDKYNEEKQYQMIFANQANSPIVSALPALNITEEILAGLNEEYIKNKNSKKEN